MSRDFRKEALDQLAISLAKLLEITKECRLDMHEPDEQYLEAHVVGTYLDNAFGEDIDADAIEKGYQELVVILESSLRQPVRRVRINLATLIALARLADLSK